jgi:hypothetical protein
MTAKNGRLILFSQKSPHIGFTLVSCSAYSYPEDGDDMFSETRFNFDRLHGVISQKAVLLKAATVWQ